MKRDRALAPRARAALTFGLLALAGGGAAHAQLAAGEKAPPVAVGEWFSHEKVDIAALDGRIVAYAFVRLEDKDCLFFLEVWEELRQELSLFPVTFLAVTNESPAVVKEAIEVEEISAPIVTNPADDAAHAFGVQLFPTVFVRNGKGEIVFHGQPGDRNQIKDAIMESIRFARQFPALPKSGAAAARHLDKWELDRALLALDKALEAKKIDPQEKQLLADTKVLIVQLGRNLLFAAEKGVKNENWPLAVTALARLTAEHKGSEEAVKAQALLAELVAREEIKDEIQAALAFAKGERYEREENWKQAYRIYESLAKQYPATKAGERAAGLAEFLKVRAK